MTPLDGRPVLTAAAMRAAEATTMDAGVDVASLMQRAGTAIAQAIRRVATGAEVLVACGPGNNGGDGHVAADVLRANGHPVRVATFGEPKGPEAAAAADRWGRSVEPLADADPAPILVDALFGTGLSRPLDGVSLDRLATAARYRIAVDLPSGVATDDGSVLSEPPRFDLTLALGAAKPAHVLQPAARYCGAVRILDIGVAAESDVSVLAAPELPDPGPDAHKYTRGMVAVVAGAMAGASELASLAALHVGAGYVVRLGPDGGPPHALVRRSFEPAALDDARIGAVVVGPGLGRDAAARSRLDACLGSGRSLVVDGDALHLIGPERLKAHGGRMILTPHAGEFDALFGKSEGGKIVRACAAAKASGAVVVFKGADTVIAAPDGRVRIASDASDWLSTAGTGDVLAGAIGAMLATGLDPFAAAAAGVWLHGDAAYRLGKAFIADDLALALRQARAAL